jgi:hypothetical protein
MYYDWEITDRVSDYYAGCWREEKEEEDLKRSGKEKWKEL